MKIVMYAHGGSENHGCEAIVRATNDLIKKRNEMHLLSYDIEQDKKYDLDKSLVLHQGLHSINKKSISFVKAYFSQKIKSEYYQMDALMHKKGIESLSNMDISLFVGGDNYCYSDVKNYIYINKYMRKKSKVNILWGTSVEPELLNDELIRKDIQKYDMIFARESISYKALKKVNPNTYLYPDPAFYLPYKKTFLPLGFEEGNTIGINMSPLIMDYEKSNGMAFENFRSLIEYLITNTTYKIALIPHVTWRSNDDRVPLMKLYEEFKDTDRIILVNDQGCRELKFIISHCRFLVGARTHATIAAYSSCIPTLVVGYSVKARGIATDLFGKEEGYVVPVQNLRDTNDLVNAFKWIEKNEDEIIELLKKKMNTYQSFRNDYAKELFEYE